MSLLLVPKPLVEGFAGAIDIEAGIVGLRDELLHVVALVLDGIEGASISGVFRATCSSTSLMRTSLSSGIFILPRIVAHPPSLGVEHVEGEPLILHAQVNILGLLTNTTPL